MNRVQSAVRLLGLSSDHLFEAYGITRVGELTNLDVIGVPVWSAFRPMGHQISVTAGKNMDSDIAKVGAIAEAIELAMMEKRQPINPSCNWVTHGFVNYPTAKDADLANGEFVEEEDVTQYITGQPVRYPSDLVWLDYRKDTIFQRSSNGQALGASPADAILGGVYECIERDALTLRYRMEEKYGLVPQRVSLSGAPQSISELIWRIDQAHLKLFVFHCTLDIQVPIYCAVIVDPSGGFIETMGYGTSLDHGVAIEKAILEAIQARAVYIAGARDDMSEARFRCALSKDQKTISKMLGVFRERYEPDFTPLNLPVEEELSVAVLSLGSWLNRMFVKMVYGDWTCAKVIVHGFETPITKAWHPNESRWYSLTKWYEQNVNICWSDIVRLRSRVVA